MRDYAKWALGAFALTCSTLSSAGTDYRSQYPLPTLTPLDGAAVNVRSATLTEQDIQDIAKAGFKYVRMDLWWTNVEYFKGRFNYSFWDNVMKWTKANGLRVNFVLNAGNTNYTKTNMTLPDTPAAQKAFIQYAVSSVNRYKGKGVLWEVFNEPDGSNLSAAAYCDLAKRTIKSIRNYGPQEWILGPSISSITNPKALSYLKVCADGGLLSQLDGLAVHPYIYDAPETVGRNFKALRGFLDSYNFGEKPILASEWGYSEPSLPASFPPADYTEGGVNLLEQSNNFGSWTWKGFYLKPALAPTLDPFGGLSATHASSADSPAVPDAGFSGFGRFGALQKGHTYTASVWLRSSGDPFTVYMGLNDSDKIGFQINNNWQRYTYTFTNKDRWNQGRMFQLWEATVNNPGWDIYGAQLEDNGEPSSTDIADSTLNLQGDFLVRSYQSCLDAGVPYMVLYEWKESPQAPGCGLNWADMTPKPAMTAWLKYAIGAPAPTTKK